MSDDQQRRNRLAAARAEPERLLPSMLRRLPPELRRRVPVRDGQRTVVVYRAVPRGVTEIRPGDWVTLRRSYAATHRQRRHGWSVLTKRVPVEHVMWAGTDENEWFYVPPMPQGNPEDDPVLYRGTQTSEDRTVRGTSSWTPSLPVALIWSAYPGDLGRPARLLESSTVHVGRLRPGAKVLKLCGGSNICSFAEVLRALQYGKDQGISHEEASKILTYLHNREIGRAAGGEFQYRVVDEDGEEITDADIGFSVRSPVTRVREFRDGPWQWDPDEAAAQLDADAFVFADAPAVHRAARALGYDALWYMDVFDGGTYAAPDVLNVEVDELEGVEWDTGVDEEDVPTHETYRPLSEGAVVIERATPTLQAIEQWRARDESLAW